MSNKLPCEEKCTGCGACANICPTQALKLVENGNGFLMPAIDNTMCLDCGKCVAVCPALDPGSTNLESPAIYAFRADDATRRESTSGGFFPVIAKLILERGGVVCGAVFDGDWNVRHIIADTWEGIQPMRGAKHVQSDMGNIYNDISGILESGRQVLFTGTPCQAGALKSFLGRDYENLLTVDLICEGVPPQKLFRQHLAEINFPGPYKGIYFRSKKYPWGTQTLRIEAADGRVYEGPNPADAYQHGMLSGMTLRKSCLDCPFCAYPRQGDLTMGDFWGYDQVIGHEADKLGTSMLFINNAKGEAFFRRLPEEYEILPVQWNPGRLPNRVYRPGRSHPGRERLFDLLKNTCFARAMDYVKNRKFDVGCVSVYDSYNFGSSLTYFALYHVLEDLGKSTMMIVPYNGSHQALQRLGETYEPGSWPEYVFAGAFADKTEMRTLNERCETFVSGSDQLFNGLCYQWTDAHIAQDWVENCKNKIAYAASFGHDKIVSLKRREREELAYSINKFDFFSVREDSGVQLCADEFGIKATHVLDPVFLCDLKHYQRLASLSSDPNPAGTRFLCAYILDPAPGKQALVEQVCAATALDYRLYSDWDKRKGFYLDVRNAKFNKRLLDLMDSEFVVVDSFHGVCFAIIFKKPFIVWANPARGYTRFTSILNETGLQSRLVHSLEEFQQRQEALLKPIDYERVYNLLKPRIEFSRNWLKTALAGKGIKRMNDFDAAMRKLREVEVKLAQRCENLENALAERDRKLERLMQAQETLLNRLERKEG